MVFDDWTGGIDAYEEYDIKNATEEMLEKDIHVYGDTRVHAGVLKAVHEFFDGNYIVCESHTKAYHIKGYKIQREK